METDNSIQTKDGLTAREIANSNRQSELFSLLSLSKPDCPKSFSKLTKKTAIHELLKAVPNELKSQTTSSNAVFDDLETFAQGIELQHLTEILKEREGDPRELLTLRNKDSTQIGIHNRYRRIDCRDRSGTVSNGGGRQLASHHVWQRKDWCPEKDTSCGG